MAKLANVSLTNTFETWRVRTNDTLDRLNAFAVNKSLLYANTVLANNVFKSSGNTVLGSAGKKTVINGTSVANGYLTVANRFDVSGNTNLGAAGKTTVVNGSLVANGSFVANGSAGSSGSFLVTNGTSIYWYNFIDGGTF